MLFLKAKTSNKVFETRFDDSLSSYVTIEMEENGVTTQYITIKQYTDDLKNSRKYPCSSEITVNKPTTMKFSLEMYHGDELSGKILKENGTYTIFIWRWNPETKQTIWMFSFLVDKNVAKILGQWIIDLKTDKNVMICQTFRRNDWKNLNFEEIEGYVDFDSM